MTDLTALLDRNQSFAEQFDAGDLPIRPRMSTIILTCLDARVDPAHLFGLGLGDALVIRNAGGRITPAVLRDLAILSVIGEKLPGPSALELELEVVHHTDCGTARLASPPSRSRRRTGSASPSLRLRPWQSPIPLQACGPISSGSAQRSGHPTNSSCPASSMTSLMARSPKSWRRPHSAPPPDWVRRRTAE